MKKHEYIKTLMSLYNLMLEENEKQAKKYKIEKELFKKNNPNKFYYWCVQEKIYSATMLHNVISIISKLENKYYEKKI